MKIEFDKIYEGWRNNLFPPEHLKKIINIVSRRRRTICNDCELNSKNHPSIRFDIHCTECGCTLSAKTKCLSCSCPLSKWTAVLTDEQEKEITNEEEGIDITKNMAPWFH